MNNGTLIFDATPNTTIIFESKDAESFAGLSLIGKKTTIDNNNVIYINNNSIVVNVATIEIINGHTLKADNKNSDIEKIIVNNGTINFNNCSSDLHDNNTNINISIGSQGIFNLSGENLPFEEINMSNGAQFNCIIENNQYRLNAQSDFKLDSEDLKKLIKVTDSMYGKFGNKENIIVEYDEIRVLKEYYKLCNKFGKNAVQNFIESKEKMPDLIEIQNYLQVTEAKDEEYLSHFNTNYVYHHEHELIDFDKIEEIINENFFEFIAVAKDPLKNGFGGNFDFPNDMLKIISSFLTLEVSNEKIDTSFLNSSEVTDQNIHSEEDITVTGNTEKDII